MLILRGDFFTGAVLAAALAKLVLRYDESNGGPTISNALRAEVSAEFLLCHLPICILLVHPAVSLVDAIHHRAHLFYPVVSRQLAALENQGTACHGHNFLRFVRDQQDCEPLHLQSVEYRVCDQSIHRGLAREHHSRKMGGMAFTSMVTGVLFLVPVSACSLR